MIKIQKEDFSIENEINAFVKNFKNTGALSSFIGYVRDKNDNKKVHSILLEVYKKMAIKKLEKIIDNEKNNNNIIDCLIIHRYGNLAVGEKIVMVLVLSEHRKIVYYLVK